MTFSMRTVAIVVSFVSLASAATLIAQQQEVFRAGTELVTIDASVREKNMPVAGLTSDDFIVTDNGVRQKIDAVSTESIPINVTLLLDTSGSVSDVIDELKSQLREAATLLGTDDQLRLLVFSAGASQVFPMQPVRGELPLDKVAAGGGTSLYDALAMGLIRRRTPERGEIVVAFTDGVDTTSAMGVTRLRDVATRSEAVLYAYIVRTPELLSLCLPIPVNNLFAATDPQNRNGDQQQLRQLPGKPWLCDSSGLTKVAESTGGRLTTVSPGNHVPDGLKKAIAEFHASYTLRYVPAGVAKSGWHDVVVKLARKGNFEIHARRGYSGGEGF